MNVLTVEQERVYREVLAILTSDTVSHDQTMRMLSLRTEHPAVFGMAWNTFIADAA